MSNDPQQPSKPEPRTIEDAACLGCGCVCDDIRLTIEADRIVEAGNACVLGESWFRDRPADDRPACLVEGQPATIDEGIERAARILAGARYPLVFGLTAATCEVQRLAAAIADRIGACIDSIGDAETRAATIAFQEVGEVTGTLGEVKNRADLIVLWGCDPVETHPRLFDRYSLTARGAFRPRGRSDRFCLAVDVSRTASAATADEFIPIGPGRDFEALWTLRALIRGIAPDSKEVEAQTGVSLSTWQVLLDRMRQARYGVIFHGGNPSAPPLGRLGHHALRALVRDLNDLTRFICLPLQREGNRAGAENVIASQTGYPPPVNLARGYPRYGPGEYEASLSLERREPDAALIVAGGSTAGLSRSARDHLREIPRVLINPETSPAAGEATVSFHAASCGINTPGTVCRMDGVPIPLRPAIPSSLQSIEAILGRIARRVGAIRAHSLV